MDNREACMVNNRVFGIVGDDIEQGEGRIETYPSATSPKLIGINLGALRRIVETLEW
jgi:hypothetical protein